MRTHLLNHLDLSPAIDCLKEGKGPVIFPTETVYGLGAPIFDEEAVQRIFEIKGRPSDNPLIAHISSLEQAAFLSDSLTPLFYALASRFWPGPLTMIIPRRAEVPSLVSAGHSTIAIRMPSHPIAKALIEGVGVPLVAPSANRSGLPSPTRLSDALEDLNGKVLYAIDGGECEVGIESTVISLVHEVPTLLRPGHISKEELENVLGQKIDTGSNLILSPGMKYRHYAPKTPIKLVFQEEELQGAFIEPTARSLFAELRAADRRGLKEIQIYCSPEMQKNEGLMNRLLRAAQK